VLDAAKNELDALFAKYGQTSMAGVIYVALFEHNDCRRTIGALIREREGNTAAEGWAMAVCPCAKCRLACKLVDIVDPNAGAPGSPGNH
jgi:hypothetical protein